MLKLWIVKTCRKGRKVHRLPGANPTLPQREGPRMVHSRAFRDGMGNPMSAPWFLEFRFWNLGFLILGFGFRLLNLDFQSLDFGTWIVKF